MSAWRRRAIESFPELRRELNSRDEIWSPYALWMELFPRWMDAHRDGEDDLLDRIYAYAYWCSQQRAESLWNSAGVCFYEHVLDHGRWDLVLPHLSDRTINDVWGLWEWRLSQERMDALRKLLNEQGRPVPVRTSLPSKAQAPPTQRTPRRGHLPRRG